MTKLAHSDATNIDATCGSLQRLSLFLSEYAGQEKSVFGNGNVRELSWCNLATRENELAWIKICGTDTKKAGAHSNILKHFVTVAHWVEERGVVVQVEYVHVDRRSAW